VSTVSPQVVRITWTCHDHDLASVWLHLDTGYVGRDLEPYGQEVETVPESGHYAMLNMLCPESGCRTDVELGGEHARQWLEPLRDAYLAGKASAEMSVPVQQLGVSRRR
jgi:hypothetical protein